ncbi:MAG: hypothetical protein QMD96_03350 [Anaerosomatales bacterium]|nr:hypothetical protein [Anaerosomatales bacterium]
MGYHLPRDLALYGTATVGFIVAAVLALLWYRRVLTRKQAFIGMVATMVADAAFMGWASGMPFVGAVKQGLVAGAALSAYLFTYALALDVGAERRAAREARRAARDADGRMGGFVSDTRPAPLTSRWKAVLAWALVSLMVAAVAVVWIIFFIEISRR